MESILSLIESGVTRLTLTLKSEDLKEFALLIEKAKEQLLPVMVSASHEALLTKKEVLEKFNVCQYYSLELGSQRLSHPRENRPQGKLPTSRHRAYHH